MNILSIGSKEIRQNWRNSKSMIMMVLFPVVLMLILGTALSGMFDASSQFKNVKVDYAVAGDTAFLPAFNAFVNQGKQMGIQFFQVETPEKGLEDVENGTSDALIKTEASGLQLIKSDRDALKADLVESVLSTFIQRYNAISAVATVNPAAAANVMRDNAGVNADFVNISSLGGKRKPGAMDYYAVSMITLIIMYASLTGAFAIKNEYTGKTMNRLLVGPVRKYEILTGKLLGALVITAFQIAVVVLFSRYVLRAYWGSHMGAVLALIMAEVAMAVSMGIGLAFIIKNDMAVNGVINLIIPVVVFLGGGYVPVESFSGALLRASDISPLRWVNKAIFQVIYSNDFSSVGTALAVNLGLAAAFILIASLSLRKGVETL